MKKLQEAFEAAEKAHRLAFFVSGINSIHCRKSLNNHGIRVISISCPWRHLELLSSVL
jgi:hypothetical protein